MYSEVLGMPRQDSFKDQKSYLDYWGVMSPPSPNLFGGSGLDATSKPQPPSSTYSFLHPSLSRRSSNPAQQAVPAAAAAFAGLAALGRQSASSADISLDGPVSPAPLPPPPQLPPPSAGLPLHRRLDRSHSEPVTERKLAPQNSSRYKTELCRPFEESGQCKYGEKCQFAHGAHELRNMSRHPKYKTDLCRTFHTTGYCPYGARCHFVHNTEEQRRPRTALGSAGEPPSPGSLSGSSSPTSMLFSDDVYKSALTPSPVPQPLHVFQFPPKRELGLLLALPPSPTPDSLTSDLETMSLSSAGSASGSPPSCSPLDQPRHLRLPVFSRMRKDAFAL